MAAPLDRRSPTLLAQISDLHITRSGHLAAGRVDTAGYLARCVARLGALEPPPDAVIVTGDLVDHGSAEEYARLRALLAPLAVPVYLMLGNHDDRAAFRAVFGDAAYLSAAEHVQYTFDVGALHVIALDSLDPGNPRGGGRLCATRRDWLARRLDEAHDRAVILALHHPPFATGIAALDAACLDPDDAAALAALVARHPNVERVICGHLHRSISARFAGTVAATAPSCAHQVALLLAGDAPAAFTFEPPAFVIHARTASGLASHHAYIDGFDGPFAY